MTTATLQPTRPTVSVRRGTPADATVLAELGARTFHDTYAPDTSADDLAAFIAATFREDLVAEALRDPAQQYLLAVVTGVDVGYASLRDEHDEPGDGGRALLLAQLYVDGASQAAGVGSALMSEAIARARRAGYQTLRLTVWERNARAIGFYRRWGFRTIGNTTFTLGREVQCDLVMALRL